MDSSLSTELAELIAAYCEVKSQSLTTLSRESGVPYGSVKRIAQGESVPELFNALKLLKVLGPSSEQCFDFIDRHYEDVGAFLKKVNFAPAKSNLRAALSDKVSFYIMHLAVSRGVTREEIQAEYGRNGLESLDDMLDQGILREVNNRITSDSFSFPDIETLLTQIKFLVEDFDVTKLGNRESMASLQVFGLNRQGVAEVYRAQKDFIESVVAIDQNPDYKGEHTMFLATLFNSMGDKT